MFTGSFRYKETLLHDSPLGPQFSQPAVWTAPDLLNTPPAPPTYPVHQVHTQPPYFLPPVPIWDKEDVTENPIVVGACAEINNQEILPEPPAMEDIMDTLQSSKEEEDDNLGKRNNLGERLRNIKKRVVERLNKA